MIEFHFVTPPNLTIDLLIFELPILTLVNNETFPFVNLATYPKST